MMRTFIALHILHQHFSLTQAQTLTFAFNVANTDQVTSELFLVKLIQ
jgi:hypothetical protein